MKLVIQIPCLDEEETLAETIAALPSRIEEIDDIEIVVIDDGSSDATAAVAEAAGARVLRFPNHQGLARAFAAGLEHSLLLGADVIVNTDADNQYRGADIGRLIAPILRGEADIVIGDRDPARLRHFSAAKRLLQRLGSWAVRQLSGTKVPDATSGFRAFSRTAALKMNVFSDFTYTLETIIQAGKKQLAIAHVPVAANPTPRPSRLFSGASHYIRRSASTLIRIYALYEPFKIFTMFGAAFLFVATAIGLRFLHDYLTTGGEGHVQSLILAGALSVIGFLTIMSGLLADLIGRNRQLSEEILLRVRRLEIGGDERSPRPESPSTVPARREREGARRRRRADRIAQ